MFQKDVKNPYELKRIPKFTVHEKSERKKPLTEEEKATRLKEMEVCIYIIKVSNVNEF